MIRHNLRVLVFLASLLLASATAFAQGTAFTYQGKLADSGNLANGQYDFQFKLFDTAAVGTGTQQGATLTPPPVTVTAGIFTVQLDFGACPTCFNGAARFLEIAVKPTSGSTFTTLSPRQPITSTPYAINAAQLGGLAASGFLQNSTAQQASSNFNVSGNGTVGGTLSAAFVNATNWYSLGGLRVFSVSGAFDNGGETSFTASNSFIGEGAGLSTMPGTLNSITGKFNAFFGAGAGKANTTGHSNAFFGAEAGQANTGNRNAFFGFAAGQANTTGVENAFFGALAGEGNTGSQNAFFGLAAGFSNNGDNNAFFGYQAGTFNHNGTRNAFFGYQAGDSNNDGDSNAFFGYQAGGRNTTGSGNTFIGYIADFDVSGSNGDNNTLLGTFSKVTSGSSNATAIGYEAKVTQSNSLVLGGITGINGGTDTSIGIGTTSPGAVLDVQRDGSAIPQTAWFTTYGAPNEILGRASDGTRAIPTATLNGTTLLSLGATGHNGNGFVTIARASIVMDAAQAWTSSATGTQLRFRTTANDTTGILTRMIITNDGNVGIGTSNPLDLLDVNGDLRVGTGTTGCVKDSDGTVIAGTCSSDARLKRDITPFPHLLEKLVQLQPVHFHWRSAEFPDRHLGAAQSFGLVAQEVENVLPELVREDAQGFKTVNYSKLPLLTLQAIKELKAENDALKEKLQKVEQQPAQIKTQATSIQHQQEQIKQQQLVINSLMKLVCTDHPNAEICK